MKLYKNKNSNDIDELIELFGDTRYDPFKVSHALEALANGKADVSVDSGEVNLIPHNDNSFANTNRQTA